MLRKIFVVITNSYLEKDEFTVNSDLNGLEIKSVRHIKITTEGALLGNIINNGINSDIVVMSDDAGQFNVFLHALCWIHTERHVNKLVGFDEERRKALESKQTEIWEFYAELKKYKTLPDKEKKIILEKVEGMK